ncbi:MAG: hypothetical protein BMS9Abin33_0859 [Gammaproteobacteria bacterium]|nr:MAG: hypothetical protein BMS9Abin33_0859 [Gammaproteobacteria bacterium]
MVNFKKKLAMVAAISAALAAPTAALATNGYFAHGYGTKTKGTVGAGVALSQDAMAAATNPAGMVMVGERLDIGAAIFSPSPRSYDAGPSATGVPDGALCGALCPLTIGGAGGDETVESGNDIFLIPHIGYNWMLGSDSSIGITVYGNGGMNTEYEGGSAQHNDGLGTSVTTPGVFGAGTTGVDLAQLFISTTYARKISDRASWGVSGIVAYQRFEAKGLGLFGAFGLSNDAANLTDNGTSTSTGFGAKVGVQGDVGSGVTLAASYQSEIAMSEFDEYAGLFAEKGGFDIPATWTIGLAWETSPKSTLVFDIQQIMYSDVPAIANPISNLNGCMGGDSTQCLGGSNGAGFGWEDMTIYKLGYQWDMSDMTWRVGYSKGDQPIPDSEIMFNILAPAVIEEHLTFGLTKALNNKRELNFAFMYALENSIESKANPFDPTQDLKLEMTQYEFEMSYGMKF